MRTPSRGRREGQRRQPGRGFTLIELLVVIVIISALVALLLPAILSARSSVRNAQVQAEISRLGSALADFKAMLRSHTNLLTAAKAARKAMRGDPSFHEKCGEGLLYCPCPSGQAYRSLETAIAQAEGRVRI